MIAQTKKIGMDTDVAMQRFLCGQRAYKKRKASLEGFKGNLATPPLAGKLVCTLD